MPELTLMTYNILHGPVDRGPLLAQVIASRQPDIVALQEVDDPVAVAQMAASIGFWMFLGRCNTFETSPLVPQVEPPRPEHLAFLTRRPLAAALVHDGDPEVMFRSILEVQLPLDGVAPGRTLRLLTVHLRAFPGPAGEHWKQREASVLRSVAGFGRRNTVILGDFNAYAPDQARAWDGATTWAPHLPDDHREAVMGAVIASLLRDGYHDALAEAPGGPVLGGTLRDTERPRVDHVLLSEDLVGSVEEATIVRTGAPVDKASDHYPVVVRLRLDDDGSPDIPSPGV